MRFLPITLAIMLAGCTTYLSRPADPLPPAGTQVRAKLTTAGAVRVSELYGWPVQELEGRVLGVDGDSLDLGILSTTEYGRPWDLSASLLLAKGEILQLDEKRIDPRRTALFVGGVGLVSGVVVAALFKNAFGSDKGDPGGEIDVTLIPLLSIRH